ncbi:hypothetical protein [Actinoplanes rectilineatus]|uniref:hypothetical protein n=1 Tax=Actinoplanes rectilineatus TaxID=113571 RepID=UPI0005F2FE0D|nr:hypothetical protein [Actinoplanes rectilineatus]
MTVTDLPATTAGEATPESERLARVVADLAAVEERMADPQGWGQLLEDERSRLMSQRAELLRAGARLTATVLEA